MAGDPADTITLTRDGGVATITIDRPEKKNAITKGMFERLRELFGEVAHEPEDRVVVVTGVEGAFSSGADLTGTDEAFTGFGAISGSQWMREVGAAAAALHKIPKPTIAAVNGVAAGAGCNLALGCDLVFASESARFSQIFANRGLTLDFGGTWLLPRLAGLQAAKHLAFTAEMLTAAQAKEYGLVFEVVADADLAKFVADYAARVAGQPPVALMLMKHGLNQSGGWTMEQALDYEAHAQATCFGTEDMREAMIAWMQKRPAEYKGR